MNNNPFIYSEKNLGLAGKMLVSTPYMEGGTCFSKTIIYVLTHNATGTLGIIVNRVITSVKADFIFNSLDLDLDTSAFNPPIYFGGPVESEKGIIIHSNEYQNKILMELNNSLALSSNVTILKDIAEGNGPVHNLLALGYTGWAPGQLEKEIKDNVWIILNYDQDLIFNDNNDEKWDLAIRSLGISPVNFSSSYGKA